ncbi:MAG: hypothetical protein BJ554DRAFT_2323 [Olpidium bornovanus]|uniref:Uncharacterized protein n=1 Tax=Olpidium bornovanus TaxID=278681 RepID=A0A8H7ZQE3_9FUNG|nr:MAG: hypothetical protein BJ554DRAFT_2323 [Olpidium bornovanus]
MAETGAQRLIAQMHTAEIYGAVQQSVTAEGRFERQNVTDYLRPFDIVIELLQLADAKVAGLTVHEDFDKQVREVAAEKTWARAKEGL